MALRIGLCSLDHGHAFSYLDCLRNMPDVDCVGIWDEQPERHAERLGRSDTPFRMDLDDLLRQDLDGLIVGSANAHHRAHVEAAAGRVSGILCEKPISVSERDASAMLEVCRETSTSLQIAFHVRFAPAVADAKAILDRGELGTALSAACTNHGSMPGSWFIDERLSGGGAVIDHTVHVIDLLRWFWNTEVTEVFAEIGEGLLHPGLGIDDAGLISFQLANGMYGTLDTSWSRKPGHRAWGNVTLEIVGTDGTLAVDAFGQALTVTTEAAGRTRLQTWGARPAMGLMRDFVGMLRTGREPSISGWDGLQALRVALAAYESARIWKPVTLAHEAEGT